VYKDMTILLHHRMSCSEDTSCSNVFISRLSYNLEPLSYDTTKEEFNVDSKAE